MPRWPRTTGDRLGSSASTTAPGRPTWTYIDRARRRYPKLIKAIRSPRSAARKRASTPLHRGKGDIRHHRLRSVITPDTVKQVIAPCSTMLRIGAVAGNSSLHRSRSVMARMLRCASSWLRFPPARKHVTAASLHPRGPVGYRAAA